VDRRAQTHASPGGAKEKENVAYVWKYPGAFHLLDRGPTSNQSSPRFAMICSRNLGGIVREMNRTALIINGANDHVHMLICVRPAHSASEIARLVKANSSRWVREKHSAGFAWQTGYGEFSVSESTVAAVTKYLAEQEHHKKRSFQEEFVAFLKKNRVEYDPKYIWD
jgi:hypothetical protein